MEESMLPLSGSTEKMSVPTAAAESTLVPVVLLKTVVVIWVCSVVSVEPLQDIRSVLREPHCGTRLDLRSCD